MDRDWNEAYMHSATWSKVWLRVRSFDAGDWPAGYKVYDNKLYWEEALCVPEGIVEDLVVEYHRVTGHIGRDRLLRELNRKFYFPEGIQLDKMVRRIKSACEICQATEPPNWQVKGSVEIVPIPDRIFDSVCLDIFSMPPTIWEGQEFDCMLVCVDRHSGWIMACPTTKLGLTAEKAAHLLLDKGWDLYGLPSVITSDQGPQFIGKWFKTMCGKLGIRQAYSQAHRPQANGRAEAAGRQLMVLLRKLNADEGINWVEALPRVIRMHHDLANDTGLSPYEIVFGRQRNLANLPYAPYHVCEEAEDFFHRIAELDA